MLLYPVSPVLTVQVLSRLYTEKTDVKKNLYHKVGIFTEYRMSPRRNWDSRTPLPQASVPPLPGTKGGGGTLAKRVRGGGVPIPTTGEKA
jgi:hypothetical protein